MENCKWVRRNLPCRLLCMRNYNLSIRVNNSPFHHRNPRNNSLVIPSNLIMDSPSLTPTAKPNLNKRCNKKGSNRVQTQSQWLSSSLMNSISISPHQILRIPKNKTFSILAQLMSSNKRWSLHWISFLIWISISRSNRPLTMQRKYNQNMISGSTSNSHQHPHNRSYPTRKT